MPDLQSKTSVSALLGAPVTDSSGTLFGHVREFAVAPVADATNVSSLAIRRSGARRSDPLTLVATAQLQPGPGGDLRLAPDAVADPLSPNNTYLLLERDLLDQQIIDVHGHKVVRVNDVDLRWEQAHGAPADSHPVLRIQEVEIGPRGAVRRLLKGLPTTTVDRLARHFRSTAIPWEFVDLIDRDPARRVKLKVEGDRLAHMHPSDLADILEDLAPAERKAVFISLNEEVAADALEEVEPRTQQAILADLDSGHVADIVEEMDPGAAADLLATLPDERSEAILEEMDPEERQDVEDLLVFREDSAAGQMTTDFVALPQAALAADALHALRTFEGDAETITDLYLLDEAHGSRLCAVIPVVHLLFARPTDRLSELPHGHLVTCTTDTSGAKVAELFDKYNLRSLPVLDEEQHLAGVIHADQVIAILRGRH